MGDIIPSRTFLKTKIRFLVPMLSSFFVGNPLRVVLPRVLHYVRIVTSTIIDTYSLQISEECTPL